MSSDDELDTTALDVGDRFELPGGALLTIAGYVPADESPETIGDARYYEAELTGAPDTLLYGPHDLDSALAGGAEYLGTVAVEAEREPFVCAGCGRPARGGERYEAGVPSLDVPVCCYGCSKEVETERRKERMANRTANL